MQLPAQSYNIFFNVYHGLNHVAKTGLSRQFDFIQ